MKNLATKYLFWKGWGNDLIRMILGIVLLGAGFIKLIYTQELVGIFEVIGLTPLFLSAFIGLLLPVIEIVTGILLLFKWEYRSAVGVTVILLFIFWVTSVYGLTVGLENDSACFGSAVESHFGWWMTARNTLLLLGGLILFKSATD